MHGAHGPRCAMLLALGLPPRDVREGTFTICSSVLSIEGNEHPTSYSVTTIFRVAIALTDIPASIFRHQHYDSTTGDLLTALHRGHLTSHGRVSKTANSRLHRQHLGDWSVSAAIDSFCQFDIGYQVPHVLTGEAEEFQSSLS